MDDLVESDLLDRTWKLRRPREARVFTEKGMPVVIVRYHNLVVRVTKSAIQIEKKHRGLVCVIERNGRD